MYSHTYTNIYVRPPLGKIRWMNNKKYKTYLINSIICVNLLFCNTIF